MKKLISIAFLLLAALTMRSQTYIDLGLPSGTKWAKVNAQGFYTYDEAVSQFGKNLPTKTQCEEIISECDWTWTGSGYKVTGPNGNSITLPAAGARDCDGGVDGVGSWAYYWSSSPMDSYFAWYLNFNSRDVIVNFYTHCTGGSVRLVQD